MDPRAKKLAEIIVNHSLRVEKGDKVVLSASDFSAFDIFHACYELCIKNGAFVEVDVFGTNLYIGRADYGGIHNTFLEHANNEQLQHLPVSISNLIAWGDKFVRLTAVHNNNFLSSVDNKKLGLWQKTYYSEFHKLINKDWLLTYTPTIGTAQQAGMSLEEFTDFYYKATVIDYKKLSAQILPLQDILDKGKVVHIKSQDTDLKLGINGRLAQGTDAGRHNIPDGECFIGPEEEKTEGYIKFNLPQNNKGQTVSGIYLEFNKGKVVKFSAEQNNNYLESIFNAHPGNRRLGELGIGMNTQIKNYIQQIIFDEKIAGTVHMALGNSYEEKRGGGKNKGTIHWDLIKDLREKGTSVSVDRKTILKNGKLAF